MAMTFETPLVVEIFVQILEKLSTPTFFLFVKLKPYSTDALLEFIITFWYASFLRLAALLNTDLPLRGQKHS